MLINKSLKLLFLLIKHCLLIAGRVLVLSVLLIINEFFFFLFGGEVIFICIFLLVTLCLTNTFNGVKVLLVDKHVKIYSIPGGFEYIVGRCCWNSTCKQNW